ncbi:BLUF domain-containing protein [Stieleria sp. JC731]|nr:BLUF domain-containing protein [Stieleria sp. JC731]
MAGGPEPELCQLIYVSAAAVKFTDNDLEKLLQQARHTNHVLDITGVLLFVDKTFFQVLEGEPKNVRALYEKIASDPRHNNTLVLSEESVGERNFGEWSMGFLRDKASIEQLPGFVDFFTDRSDDSGFIKLSGDSQRISHVIEGFRRGRWRRTNETASS